MQQPTVLVEVGIICNLNLNWGGGEENKPSEKVYISKFTDQ